jgi:hypothetical protein
VASCVKADKIVCWSLKQEVLHICYSSSRPVSFSINQFVYITFDNISSCETKSRSFYHYPIDYYLLIQNHYKINYYYLIKLIVSYNTMSFILQYLNLSGPELQVSEPEPVESESEPRESEREPFNITIASYEEIYLQLLTFGKHIVNQFFWTKEFEVRISRQYVFGRLLLNQYQLFNVGVCLIMRLSV